MLHVDASEKDRSSYCWWPPCTLIGLLAKRSRHSMLHDCSRAVEGRPTSRVIKTNWKRHERAPQVSETKPSPSEGGQVRTALVDKTVRPSAVPGDAEWLCALPHDDAIVDGDKNGCGRLATRRAAIACQEGFISISSVNRSNRCMMRGYQ